MEKYKNETYTKQRTQGFVKCGCCCLLLAMGLVGGYYLHKQAKKYSEQLKKYKSVITEITEKMDEEQKTIDKLVDSLSSEEENESSK